MSNLSQISIAIIAKNAMKTLGRTLDSVVSFNEVILLVDNESHDQTEVIASSYGNVKIFKSAFTGFGTMKRKAVDLCTNDWVLSLDTDEVLSEPLLDVIGSLKLDQMSIYKIKRNNCFKGRHIEACGWDNDYPIRLFNKKSTTFDLKQVHESVISDGMKVCKINQAIIHYSYDNEDQLKEKAVRYAILYKAENSAKKPLPLFIIYLKAFARFIRDFIFRRGFLYGKDGFVISKYNALGVCWKYGSKI